MGNPDESTATAAETGKRKIILDGARRVFRAAGFDAASMDKIAQAAGVSKGTLYVYFRNKEELFQALVMLDRAEAAEQVFKIEEDDREPEEVLLQLGRRFVGLMTKPDHIALIRMVMGAAEKVPDVGRTFYEMGPAYGTKRLAAYLTTQVERGKLTIEDDVSLAAIHFLNLCQGHWVKELLFMRADQPSEAEITKTVASAVRIFMAAYRTRQPAERAAAD
ncbi:TetR/AcrR family transcriptional regulator [Acuticoccus sp. M5D2P5]|uniref:TetR/AcrR family transcriptional regulator n=1 Tax=Acuticoccus kalidii TaxID=2910977 RepID=UPI001F48EF9D|nr:TetR/AcrR family transcriptional regulator [Acuticoccus kalidii]MCF3935675.1 TetR/AcrR family transcriptional regulator [Acuticoccus kalidii]